MNSNTTAIRKMVPFGLTEIEGYLLPKSLWTESNMYGVSKTQAALLTSPDYDRSQAAKLYSRITKLSTIPGKDSETRNSLIARLNLHPKVKVEAEGRDAYVVDILPADQLVTFLKIAKKLGSKAADELIDDLAGLSIQQIFADAFEIKMEAAERLRYMELNWMSSRKHSESMHPWFQQYCIANRYPAWDVHDAMTVAIFNQTAEQARHKPLVVEGLDASIGLNHQEDPEGQELLARAKRKFCLLKTGTWQEKVKRAVKLCCN